jgi:diketogulonate reductase-like aldo/keto reductase
VIKQVADQLHATSFQVALAWLLKRSKVILPISGTASIKHLEENIASASLELPQATYKKLAAVRPSYASHNRGESGDEPTVSLITYAGTPGMPTSIPTKGEKPEY